MFLVSKFSLSQVRSFRGQFGSCEMEESAGGEQRDRLSELPDSIILHGILSLLPIRDVISTTFLSRRWNNLWATIPCLNFIYMDNLDDELDGYDERTRNFVNRALLFWKGAKILKFYLDFDCTTLAGDVDLWVRFAVDNNVEELSLNFMYSSYPAVEWEELAKCVYIAPQCLYSCSSITDLNLVGCNLRIHESPIWNQLKTLRLDGFWFSEDSISGLMFGCPLLEDFVLILMEGNEDLNIQSTSLKKLQIYKYLYDGHQPSSLDTNLRIWCPNLKILELLGIMYGDYRLENVSSLTDATLSFDGRSEFISATLRDLVSALKQVERVTLSGWCVEVLSMSEIQPKPLPNVKFIKLYVVAIELEKLVNLLANFPNLKMLVVEVEQAPPGCTFTDKPLEAKEGLSTSSFPPKVAEELLTLQRSHPTMQVILNKYC